MVPVMAPSPIPAPLPPWARALIQLSPLIAAGLQEALQYIGVLDDATSSTPDAWMHVQLVGQPNNSVELADNFVTTMDIVNITNGAVDSSWTTTDITNVSSALATLQTAWMSRMSADYQWREQRYYKRYFNAYSETAPFAKSGPPQEVRPFVGTGTGTGFQAPQVAVTSTDRTAYPRHWGRNYWPHPGSGVVSSGGYISQANVDSWATAVQSCYQTLMASEYFPVVVVTQVDKVPTRGLLTVSEVQVDNVFDVVRRRRSHKTTYRKRLSV